MAENSLIDYVDASWSPVIGCTKCSVGCDHCFAIRQVWRMAHNPNPKIRAANEGLVEQREYISSPNITAYNWTGQVRCLPDRLDWPLRWRKPKRVLVPTLGDLFHEDVPGDFIYDVFHKVIAATPWHRYLVLTKRVQRMAELWPMLPGSSASHVFPGVTVCNQDEADAKVPVLLSIPAAGHWVSVEPCLSEVVLVKFMPCCGYYDGPGHSFRWRYDNSPNRGLPDNRLAWVVAGAETGPGARPAHPDWLRSLRDQCASAGVPYFLKATGAKRNHLLDGVAHRELPDALKVGGE